ncbi:hypothetical protein CE91St41_01870 [Oscillospiraceae bacterium]|nr:hypothetical protein CE91St40_01870 [Oscillospiraceae bacterium]BDF73298.1 hypothetical protein CE91St41_01870 [Oscillospiraceae bacterium]
MKPLKVKLSITLDEPILERLKLKAEEDDRSVSSYINQALKEYWKLTEQA